MLTFKMGAPVSLSVISNHKTGGARRSRARNDGIAPDRLAEAGEQRDAMVEVMLR